MTKTRTSTLHQIDFYKFVFFTYKIHQSDDVDDDDNGEDEDDDEDEDIDAASELTCD